MELRVLGGIAVVHDGDVRTPAGAKERSVLARLLVDPGRPVPAEALLDGVWDDADRGTARSLSVRISRLRRFLADLGAQDVLVRDHVGYRLAIDPGDVDACRFERAVREAVQLPPPAAVAALDGALAMWRGPPFPELPDDLAALAEARRLEQVWRGAEEARAEGLSALGRLDEALPALERLVEAEPLREQVVRSLMLALYRAGRQADALAAYRALAGRLLELGLQPVQETRALERQILEQDAALSGGAGPRTAGARLVGRDAQLALLRGALRAACAGDRRTVLIGGEAGVGKTALVDAALAEAAGGERLLVAAGQCQEHRGPGEPYLPVLDALGSLARAPGAEGVVQLLARHAPTWLVQLPWLVADEDAEALERRVRGATGDRMLRELLEAVDALAEMHPVVLLLEDLHWADDPSLDVIAALGRRRHPARVLTIGTFRTADRTRLPALVAELSLAGGCEDLPLGRLAPQALAALVVERFPGGAPDAVADALARRTGGNPLFAGLLLDDWLQTGALVRHDDGVRVAGDLDAGVPLTLRAHLEHRLAALTPPDAELLRAAAIAGTGFTTATVAAALDEPEDAVGARCAALAHDTTLVEVRDAGYAFAHGLEREVCRDQLPAGRRAELHARIGTQLADAYGVTATDHAVELAHHFVEGRDAEQAMRFLRAAGERAFARSASTEGIRHLRSALDVVAELPSPNERLRCEVEVRAQLGQALVAAEGWSSPTAEAELLRAREAAGRLDDNEPLVSVLLALATLCEVRGEVARAHALTEECLRRAPAAARNTRLESEELLACSLFHQGAFLRALEHAEAGVALFDEDAETSGGYSTFPATLGDNAGVLCQDWAGLALWFVGRPDQALRRAQLALDLAADPRRAYSRATAWAQLGVVHACRREPDAALRASQATVEAGRDLGYVYRVAMGRVLRGWALALLGDPANGVAEAAEGLAEARSTGARMDDPHFLALLAEAHLLDGDPAACAAAAAEGIELGRRERAVYVEPELRRLLAAANPDPAAAQAELRRAIAQAREHGARSLELRARTDLAVLLSTRPAAGAGPRATLTRLLRSFDEGHDTPDLRAAAQAAGGGQVSAR